MEGSDLLTAAIAVAAAMIGGTIEHLWSAARARRAEVERAANDLQRIMPTAVASLSTTVSESTVAMNPMWRQAVTEATDLVAFIRVRARGFWGARGIRDEADDVAARLGAAQLRADFDQRPLQTEELPHIGVRALAERVFGPQYTVDSAVRWYRDNGFEKRYPGKVAK